MLTPIIAEITWPPIKFRGWAKGLSITPYTKTQEAPNEPIRKTKSDEVKILNCNKLIIPKPTNDPKKAQKCSLKSIKVSLYKTYFAFL